MRYQSGAVADINSAAAWHDVRGVAYGEQQDRALVISLRSIRHVRIAPC
jgi:hypothetical protein